MEGMEKREKRLYKRITLSLPINYEILDTDKKELDHTVCKDISEGGLKLIVKKFYPPKTKFLIKIDIPEMNKMITAIAETVWSFNMRFSNRYYNGLRFCDLNTPSKKLLNEYISMEGITRQIN